MDKIKIKRALLSVYDKTGVLELATTLHSFGVEILSTGGTARYLSQAGLPIRSVDEFTGHPEILDGRVKTLHPRVHAAILARREIESHMNQCSELGIELIDMVVVNLYPFEQTVTREGISLEDAVEQIDIGGPTMLRSSAKNFRSVAVVTSPDQYAEVSAQLCANAGELDLGLRFRLARKVFQRTSQYDRKISEYLEGIDISRVLS